MDYKLLRKCSRNPYRIFESRESMKTCGEAISLLIQQKGSSSIQGQAREIIRQFMVYGTHIFKEKEAYRLLNLAKMNGGDRDAYFDILQLLKLWAESSDEAGEAFYGTLVRSLRFEERPLEVDPEGKSLYDTPGIHLGALAYIFHGMMPHANPVMVESLARLYERCGNEEVTPFEILADLYDIMEASINFAFIASTGGQGLRTPFTLSPPANHISAKGLAMVMERNRAILESSEFRRMRTVVKDKTEDIVALTEMLWEDIEKNPRYDVRPKGADCFEAVGVIGQLRGSHRYFIREHVRFPSVALVLSKQLRLGGILYNEYEYEFGYAERVSENMVENAEVTDYEVADVLDYLVNLAAYHKIVCNSLHEGAKSNEPAKANRGRGSGFRIHEFVRSHFRKLLPGWKPSAEKYVQALARLGRLPEGYTFVEGFERDRSTADQESSPPSQTPVGTHPLFRIGSDDVLSWIE